jgi:hypothetical protein
MRATALGLLVSATDIKLSLMRREVIGERDTRSDPRRSDPGHAGGDAHAKGGHGVWIRPEGASETELTG